MSLILSEIEIYAEQQTSEESVEIRRLIRRSDEELQYIDMISGKIVGQLLSMLIKISGAKRVLEIGTFTGYSALRMAEALPQDGTVTTCEYNERYETIARSCFEESKHKQKITLKIGPAFETINRLDKLFDFIFLDADKNNYLNYYQALLPILKMGGLLVIDNVLWEGKVLQPCDTKSKAIDKLNKTIAEDNRVEQVLLPVRDGVTIIRKK